MEEGKPFLLNIFTFNYLRGYLVENPIQTLIIRRHIVYLVWFIKRAWAACGQTSMAWGFHCSESNQWVFGVVVVKEVFGFADLTNIWFGFRERLRCLVLFAGFLQFSQQYRLIYDGGFSDLSVHCVLRFFGSYTLQSR